MEYAKKILLAGFCCLLCSSLSAQFQIRLSKGDSLRREGDLDAAIAAFKEQIRQKADDEVSVYNIACAYAKSSGMNHYYDSAFKYLEILGLKDSTTTPLTDPDFINLWKDARWEKFESAQLSRIMAKVKKDYPLLNQALAKKLWRMSALDQAYYADLETAERKFGKNSSINRALWDLKARINEQNQKDLIRLIDSIGWPKKSEAGARGASAAFLIIQHSDLVKQKQYLPVIKELCEKNEASWESYALMYDRIQIGEGKSQLYGSQIRFNSEKKAYELFPVEDEKNLNKRRKDMGLQPIEEYVSRWGIKYQQVKQ